MCSAGHQCLKKAQGSVDEASQLGERNKWREECIRARDREVRKSLARWKQMKNCCQRRNKAADDRPDAEAKGE